MRLGNKKALRRLVHVYGGMGGGFFENTVVEATYGGSFGGGSEWRSRKSVKNKNIIVLNWHI